MAPGPLNGLSLLWVFSRRSRWRLGLSVIVSALLAFAEIIAFSAVVPLAQLFSGVQIADSAVLRTYAEATGSTNTNELVAWMCGSMLVLFVAKGICGLVARWWILGFIYDEEALLTHELVSYYADQDLEFHLGHPSTDLLRNLNESISRIFVFGIVGLVGFLSELTFVICVGVVLIAVSPEAMGVFIGYVCLATWVILAVIRPRTRRAALAMSTSSGEIYRLGGDILKGFREVHLTNSAPFMVDKYMRARRASTDAHRRAGFLTEAPRYLLEIVFITGLALFAGILFLTRNAEDALPILTLVIVIGFRLVPTLSRLMSFASLVRLGLPAFESVRPHLEQARTRGAGIERAKIAVPLDLGPGLAINDVEYRYPDAQDGAINGITLFLPAGTSTALVGRSGSGKSTLADLVCGLLRPSAGSVAVGSEDIALHPERWNATIGVVSQSTYILDATIRENVAFGVPEMEIDDAAVAAALDRAGLTDVVDALPKGPNTRLSEDGASLSGGQRQRVGLARAFYTRPRFLVLDEATSALDNVTEAKITETLEGLRGEVTTLVIAHRLSTVQGCDQVALLDRGRIVAVGSFSDLCESSAEFAEMVRLGAVDGHVPAP